MDTITDIYAAPLSKNQAARADAILRIYGLQDQLMSQTRGLLLNDHTSVYKPTTIIVNGVHVQSFMAHWPIPLELKWIETGKVPRRYQGQPRRLWFRLDGYIAWDFEEPNPGRPRIQASQFLVIDDGLPTSALLDLQNGLTALLARQ